MCHIYTDTDRDVVVDALGPAIQVNKPVDSGQLRPEQLLPLGVDHGVNTADVIDGDDAVGGGAGICNERDISKVRSLDNGGKHKDILPKTWLK